jgi:POT family proton-dependent oligopeptide transporter
LPSLTQEQLGRDAGLGKPFTLTDLDERRGKALGDGSSAVMEWPVVASNVGMGLGGAEMPASLFQAANPIFIILFGLVFTFGWTFLASRGLEPSTPVKFACGLLLLGLGFGALWYGTQTADARGMVGVGWLLLGYLLHTTGELCISPVGLSMVTKLSPRRIVSTVMGAWYLAISFSSFLGGLIARLTGVSGEEGAAQVIPPPSGTVHLYGDVFGQIGIIASVSALICFALSPLLRKWMHAEAAEH